MRRLLQSIVFISNLSLGLGAHEKLAPELEQASDDQILDVIVQYRLAPDPTHHDKVRRLGGKLHRELSGVRGGAYSLRANRVRELANDPDVSYVTPDRVVRGSALDYAQQTIGSPIAWNYGYNGSGIGVAVIDSGVSNAEDLKNGSGATRIVYNESFLSGGTDDYFGHGEHVAGIIAGNGSRSTGSAYTFTFKGVAPGSQVINLRVLDQYGNGTDSAVISAIGRAIQLKTKYNIRIINLSLGRPVYESYTLDPLCQAVEQAWRAGIVVVAAAGNEGRNNSAGTNGYGTILAPGNDPYVITVGAMKTLGTASRADDRIASYSSKGPTLIDHIVKPDIVAPGNQIVSLYSSNGQLDHTFLLNAVLNSWYLASPNGALSGDYYVLSGTSMAAPMVSGTAALLLQQNPNLTPDQVKARLMKTASKNFPMNSITTDPATGITYTSQYDIFTVGAGYLDVWAALNNSDLLSGTAPSPAAIYNPTTKTVSLAAAWWGDSVLWGDSVVWGDSVFLSGGSTLWGDSMVWGDSTNRAFSILWGDSVLWGDGTLTSDTSNISITGEP